MLIMVFYLFIQSKNNVTADDNEDEDTKKPPAVGPDGEEVSFSPIF